MTKAWTNSDYERTRSGFTVLEVTLVSSLMVLLAIMLSAAWSGMGRPSVDASNRCRVMHEANLAVASLARDLCGYWRGDQTGKINKHKIVGRMQPGDAQLRLCFDGGTSPNGTADWASPDTVITYERDGEYLTRWNENSGDTIMVSRYLTDFSVIDLGGGRFEVSFTLSYRDITRTYTVEGVDP